MEETVKKKMIRQLSNKLMELLDDLELEDSVEPKELAQLFDLFTRLEDYQPQVEEEIPEEQLEEEKRITEEWAIRFAKQQGYKTAEEWKGHVLFKEEKAQGLWELAPNSLSCWLWTGKKKTIH
jgi:hypothetical protein